MFDAQKSFNDNLAAYRAACEAIDADCAKILFDNIDVFIEHGSDRAARQDFNARVKIALEGLAASDDPK